MIDDAVYRRRYWLDWLLRIAEPVLDSGADGRLAENAPFRGRSDAPPRKYTALEAGGRLLSGLAPWLEAEVPAEEVAQQASARELACRMLDYATRPGCPGRWNFDQGDQPLVDAAYLAHALLRAPHALVERLPSEVRKNLTRALLSTRAIAPHFNNWLLFSAMVEAALLSLGERPDLMRVDCVVRQFNAWYVGDGTYSDGPEFHADYYNAFVIHPMLVDVTGFFWERTGRYAGEVQPIRERASRYAGILERSISPEGTFPVIGRSIAYRFGAMYGLAFAALEDLLPDELGQNATRCALTAVLRRFDEFPSMFDQHGWLQVGFCGHQPELGEFYVSGSSCYLCANMLVPLGLPASHPFWSGAEEAWTARRLWAGGTAEIDHALGHHLQPGSADNVSFEEEPTA